MSKIFLPIWGSVFLIMSALLFCNEYVLEEIENPNHQTNTTSSVISSYTSSSTFTFSYDTNLSSTSESSSSLESTSSSEETSETGIQPPPIPDTPNTDVTNVWIENGSEAGGILTLYWTNPWTTQFDGVLIRFSMFDYPVDPTDGELLIQLPASADPNNRVVHAGLIPNNRYYYTLFTYDTTGTYTAGVQVDAVPWDNVPPGNVTDLTSSSEVGRVILDWENPSDEDFYEVEVRWKTNNFPSNPSDGNFLTSYLVTDPDNDTAVFDKDESENALENGLEYYFTIFTYDIAGNYTVAGQISGSPFFNKVTDVTSYPSENQVHLTWTNPDYSSGQPDERYDGTRIVVSSTAMPVTIYDGTIVGIAKLPAKAYTVTGLTDSTTYYFGLFGYEDSNSKATSRAATATETPSAARTVLFEGFEDTLVFDIPNTAPATWSVSDTGTGCGNNADDYWGTLSFPGSEFVYQGNRSLWCNMFTSDTSRYPFPPFQYNCSMLSVMRIGLNLSGYTHVTLQFNERSQFGSGEEFRVELNGIEKPEFTISYADGSPHYRGGDWYTLFEDCSAELAGQPAATIDFVFDSNTSSESVGIFLDNITIDAW
jgi:hypothetical protein